MKNSTIRLTAVVAAFFLMFASFGLADAQTKKRTTKRTPRPTPTPVSTQTLPVIISQADQYQEAQPVITDNTENTTDVQVSSETTEERIRELNARIKTLEGSKQIDYDQKQKRLLLNLDILTRAEQRSESLRKQLFELVERENSTKAKLETLEYDLRPDMIERQVAFAGSLRPEELREAKRKTLESEKTNLSNLLIEIQRTRASLEQNVQRADLMVEKLRAVLEKDIDDALSEEPKNQ